MHDIRPYITQPFRQPGTLLYVGARIDGHSWFDELYQAGNDITILEIWQPNIDGLIRDSRVKNLIQGDVRNVKNIFDANFDYVWWWHGPEHLKLDEIDLTLQYLESKTNKVLACACPYGIYPQGVHAGNPYETH